MAVHLVEHEQTLEDALGERAELAHDELLGERSQASGEIGDEGPVDARVACSQLAEQRAVDDADRALPEGDDTAGAAQAVDDERQLAHDLTRTDHPDDGGVAVARRRLHGQTAGLDEVHAVGDVAVVEQVLVVVEPANRRPIEEELSASPASASRAARSLLPCRPPSRIALIGRIVLAGRPPRAGGLGRIRRCGGAGRR